MTQLDRDREKAAEVITRYVKENGHVEKTNKEIMEILRENNATPKDKMYQNPDICYNRTNAANLDTFKDDVHIFEYLGRNRYLLLGSDYPYTGDILWKPQGQDETFIIGEWLKGSIIAWNPEYRIAFGKLENSLKEEVSRIDEETSTAVGEDKEALVKVRVNQGEFRSHIKPWSESTPEEKTDVNNGLLLCPNHDRVFDKGMISFDANGTILISDELIQRDQMMLNLDEKMSIEITDKNRDYFAYHRKKSGL